LIVVPDAGPLIYLGGAGHLDVLRRLYTEVVVPRIVFDEVVVAGAGMTGADAVAAARWLRVEDVAPDPDLLDVLDRGEAAALPLAARCRATLLVDDSAARAVAGARGIPVIGTIGVLLQAKRRQYLAAVGPVIDQMEQLGMYVSARLREEVVRLAGEDG
jgi:predicted nucleic acid-binding protein